jgi:hypothetical protein
MKTRVGRSMVGNVSAVLGTLKQLVGSTSPGIDRDVLVLDDRQDVTKGGTRSSLRGVSSNRRSSCQGLSWAIGGPSARAGRPVAWPRG